MNKNSLIPEINPKEEKEKHPKSIPACSWKIKLAAMNSPIIAKT